MPKNYISCKKHKKSVSCRISSWAKSVTFCGSYPCLNVHIYIWGHHFCDDFSGHNAFISINVSGVNIFLGHLGSLSLTKIPFRSAARTVGTSPAFRSFSGPTNSTSLVAAWCLVFGADILSSPEKITYQNSQEIPSKMEQHCNAVKSCKWVD